MSLLLHTLENIQFPKSHKDAFLQHAGLPTVPTKCTTHEITLSTVSDWTAGCFCDLVYIHIYSKLILSGFCHMCENGQVVHQKTEIGNFITVLLIYMCVFQTHE